MTIAIANGTKSGFIGADKVYIGRQNSRRNLPQSPLANPYVVGEKLIRSKAIALYREWLWQQIKAWRETGNTNPAVVELLNLCELTRQGVSVTLVCWCHPQPCHGDVIVRCIEWMQSQGID